MYSKRFISLARKLSIILTAAMLFTSMPVTVFADQSLSGDAASSEMSSNGIISEEVSDSQGSDSSEIQSGTSGDSIAVSDDSVSADAEISSDSTDAEAAGSIKSARTISAGDVKIVSENSSEGVLLKITNLSSDNIYAYIISNNMASENAVSLNAVEMTHDKEISFGTYYYTASGDIYPLAESSNYTLCVSSDAISENYAFYPKYYLSINQALQIPVATAPSVSSNTTTISDGSLIRMKAVSNRTQQITISWSPKGDFKYYRYFTLKKLASDGISWNTVADKRNRPFVNKTAHSFRDTQFSGKNGSVYMLLCYTREQYLNKADESQAAKFISVAAPYMYYAESLSSDSIQYCFSDLASDENLSYRLEAATQRCEYSEKHSGGFGDTTYINCTQADITDNIPYNITSKVSVNAVRGRYYNPNNMIQPDTRYYCRVKTVYTYMNKTFTSAPSNILSMKQGTERCSILWVNGQNPEYDNDTAHKRDGGTCYRRGYIVFTGVDNAVKYQLLRCDRQYGRYSVIKTYRSSDSRHIIKAPKSYQDLSYLFDNKTIYYMQYNNFVPERTYYYAVRTIDAKGNVSGFGDGFENTTDFDKVQELEANTVNDKTLVLTWISDPCARQYLIYRANASASADLATYSGINPHTTKTLVKVISNHPIKGTSENYCRYLDRNLETHTDYIYTVRPIYSRSIAASLPYSKKVDEEETGYNKYLADPSTATTSIVNDYPKRVYAVNYDSHHLTVKWSPVAGAKFYELQFSTDPSNNSNWTDISDNIRGTSRTVSVDPGQKYYFQVRGNDGSDWSDYSIKPRAYHTTPLACTNLQAEYRENNSDYYKGAYLIWSPNSRETAYSPQYNIYCNNSLIAFTQGTSFYDEYTRNRGDNYTYRVETAYGNVKGNSATVNYCKPSSIYFADANGNEISSLSMYNGASATVRIYFNPSDSTVGKMDSIGIYQSSTILQDLGWQDNQKDGNSRYYVNVTFKAVKAGKSYVKAQAKRYTDNTNDLQKYLTVTVIDPTAK